jgi:transposase, IS5 family
VIDGCKRIAQAEGIAQRQSYSRMSKQLLRDSYHANHLRRAKKATKAHRKLRTLAGRVLRVLEKYRGRTICMAGNPLSSMRCWLQRDGI